MNRRPRRNHSPAFKAKVALAGVPGDSPSAAMIPACWFAILIQALADCRAYLRSSIESRAACKFGLEGIVSKRRDRPYRAGRSPDWVLPEAVASANRVLARQDGPTVLVGHSFSGMIVTEAGVHPNVSTLVYVAARAPDAGENYTALAKTYPTPPASAGILFDGDEGRLSEEAFLRDFAGDLPEAKAKVLYAVQQPFHKALPVRRHMRHGGQSQAITPFRQRTARSIRTLNVSWPNGWAPRPSR